MSAPKQEQVDFESAAATLRTIAEVYGYAADLARIKVLDDDPLVVAVADAGSEAMRDWGDWWDANAFLEALNDAGYRVVPK